MLFSSSIFLFGFLPACLLIYYLIKNRKVRNLFLFISSLFFYAWGEPIFSLIMILSIVLNYIFGILIENYREDKLKSKVILSIMLLVNLNILFIFKYLGFFITNINSIFALNLTVPNISLPIGISFFTFQAISYVIDIYRKTDNEGAIINAQKNIINVGLYISFFPQLIAGPIVRYKTIAQQINERKESFDKFSEGVRRFIIGFSKKVLLANNLGLIADKVFVMDANNISVSLAWLGAIAYSLQIFYDFSGYSDMAIGLGKMFGFDFLENFNYPYISKSVSEFWRRWHISLGSWFRDYVYIPLGGSRCSKGRLILNLFVVWFLTGLWHGANWTFVVWGLYYFILLTCEKLLKINIKENGVINLFKHIVVIIITIIGWTIFKSSSISYAFNFIKSMFALNGNSYYEVLTKTYLQENIYFIIFACIFAMPVLDYIKNLYKKYIIQKGNIIIHPIMVNMYFVFYVFIYVGVLIISMSYIVKGSYNPFIYFNF